MVLAVASLLFEMAPLRPPAVPLVTHSPYVSTWLMGDQLAEDWPRHWTGGVTGMMGMVRIDGKVCRWMGPAPALDTGLAAPALKQTSVAVTATRSLFTFEDHGVRLEVEFCSPLLADDVELVARPVSYLTISASPTDGQHHEIEAYVDFTGEWVVHNAGSPVHASRYRLEGRDVLSIRADGARPLGAAGDQVRIDWGALSASAPGEGRIGGHAAMRGAFARGEKPASDDMRFPRPARDDWPVIGFWIPLDQPATVAIGFDEGYAVEYLRRPLRPYWNRREAGFGAMFRQAIADAQETRTRAAAFDAKVNDALVASGGLEYAAIGALAYRQCLAGHGIAQDIDGDLLMFSKENTSNGCIATVDVTFPASPFFLHFNQELLKAQLRPILEYAASPRWPHPFAPHDLGTYPLANGQVYGGGERDETNQMPVEESANMLLMIAALARVDGDGKFAEPFLPVLEGWAGYLRGKGFDPEEQLCTDDFTGHLAHNANLSIKAILALRAWSEICERAGRPHETDAKLAADWAGEWIKRAWDPSGMARLAFDKPGTWSQKYNLYWDKLLGYDLFPADLVLAELRGYAGRSGRFGFPLDSRAKFTKTDWLVWSASLSPNRKGFEALIRPLFRFLNETPSRVPFTDWYETDSGQARPMYARTVIGGVFARALLDSGRMAPAP